MDLDEWFTKHIDPCLVKGGDAGSQPPSAPVVTMQRSENPYVVGTAGLYSPHVNGVLLTSAAPAQHPHGYLSAGEQARPPPPVPASFRFSGSYAATQQAVGSQHGHVSFGDGARPSGPVQAYSPQVNFFFPPPAPSMQYPHGNPSAGEPAPGHTLAPSYSPQVNGFPPQAPPPMQSQHGYHPAGDWAHPAPTVPAASPLTGIDLEFERFLQVGPPFGEQPRASAPVPEPSPFLGPGAYPQGFVPTQHGTFPAGERAPLSLRQTAPSKPSGPRQQGIRRGGRLPLSAREQVLRPVRQAGHSQATGARQQEPQVLRSGGRQLSRGEQAQLLSQVAPSPAAGAQPQSQRSEYVRLAHGEVGPACPDQTTPSPRPGARRQEPYRQPPAQRRRLNSGDSAPASSTPAEPSPASRSNGNASQGRRPQHPTPSRGEQTPSSSGPAGPSQSSGPNSRALRGRRARRRSPTPEEGTPPRDSMGHMNFSLSRTRDWR